MVQIEKTSTITEIPDGMCTVLRLCKVAVKETVCHGYPNAPLEHMLPGLEATLRPEHQRLQIPDKGQVGISEHTAQLPCGLARVTLRDSLLRLPELPGNSKPRLPARFPAGSHSPYWLDLGSEGTQLRRLCQ